VKVSLLKSVGDPGTGIFHAPPLDSKPLELRLKGAIARNGETIALDELLDLETMPFAQDVGIECVSAGNVTLAKSSVRFAGVRFSTLAECMGLDPYPGGWQDEVPTVIFRSAAWSYGGPKDEKHCTSLPLRDCLDPRYQVMLATHLEGEPLPYEHGGPLRLVVGPELYFYKALKWLAEIEVVHEPLDQNLGTWEQYSGYHKRARVRFEERFTPMIRHICAVKRAADGSLEDETEALPLETHAAALREAIEQRDFSRLVGAKLQEIDKPLWQSLKKQGIEGFMFKDGDFHAKLRGTSFAGFSFVGCDLSGCNFSLSIFSGAKFSKSDGSEPAKLIGCDLEGAKFQNAQLRNFEMQDATLTNVTFFEPSQVDRPTDRVDGLNVQGAINLDPATSAWLEKNGATV
jgi:DMSO/TMAO reductase YedYZ molybdopterin-dependent catalytic subunit